ncbi:MAG: hypothetical protein M3315_01165 [Actinomycetota bacterium]|nr:hypothetical protein [Actinomycetota bacterium]
MTTQTAHYTLETSCARPYIVMRDGEPQAEADETSWVAVMDDNGNPIMDLEVFSQDTGSTRTYQSIAPPEPYESWTEVPGFFEAVASLREQMASADREVWEEWLEENALRAFRVYPRDFANEFDLVLTRGDKPEGDADPITTEQAAEILSGQWGEWHGSVVWPEGIGA